MEHPRRTAPRPLTRAIDRLVICGAEGERGRPPGCWWNLAFDALKPVSVEEPADDGEGKVWRYRKVPPLARRIGPVLASPPADNRIPPSRCAESTALVRPIRPTLADA